MHGANHPVLPRRAFATLVTLVTLGLSLLPGGCSALGRPTPAPVPSARCAVPNVAIAGALPCERLVAIALQTLQQRTPADVARGIVAIDVTLAECPEMPLPPVIDCGSARFAEFVTVTFRPAPPQGRTIEPSLTVAIEPLTGRVLGIANPLME